MPNQVNINGTLYNVGGSQALYVQTGLPLGNPLNTPFNITVPIAFTNVPTVVGGVTYYLVYSITNVLNIPVFAGAMLLGPATLNFFWINNTAYTITCFYGETFLNATGSLASVFSPSFVSTATPNIVLTVPGAPTAPGVSPGTPLQLAPGTPT